MYYKNILFGLKTVEVNSFYQINFNYFIDINFIEVL